MEIINYDELWEDRVKLNPVWTLLNPNTDMIISWEDHSPST